MKPFTAAEFKKIVPRARADIVTAIVDNQEWLDDYEVNTANRCKTLFGQMSIESDYFKTTEEYASGADYQGRVDLGNLQPGDGKRYKGRGLMQLTGRANYAALSEIIGVDLVRHPEKAAEPALSFKIALEYWKKKRMNALADHMNVLEISIRVNGRNRKTGLPNHLDEREAWTNKFGKLFTPARFAVAAAPRLLQTGDAPAEDHEFPEPITVESGDTTGFEPRKGEGQQSDNQPPLNVQPVTTPSNVQVRAVQMSLKNLGYHEVGGADGVWGGMTAAGIAAFKNDRSMSGAAVIDKALMDEITVAENETLPDGKPWSRPLAPERANATPAEVATKVEAVKQSQSAGWWAWLMAIPAGVLTFLKGLYESVLKKFQEVREYVEPVQDFLTDIDPIVWFGLIFVVALVIVLRARAAAKEGTKDFNTGRLS